MAVKYYLKDKANKSESSIYAVFAYESQRLKLSTKLRVLPKYWNKTKNRVREVAEYPISKQINASLTKLQNKIETSYLDLKLRGMATDTHALRNYLNGNIRTDYTLAEYFDKMQKELISDRGFAKAKGYRTTYNVFIKFCEENKYYNFSDINYEFYTSYVRYLQGCNYAQNNIATHIAKFKAIMAMALRAKLHNNIEYQHFKSKEEKVYNVYLNEEEITKIYKCKGLTAAQEQIKDLFVAACWLGLRVGDWARLSTDKITEDGNKMRIKTSKTGAWVVIPLHKYVREIIEKYNGFPRVYAEQFINRELKKIAKKAKIKTPIILSRTIGGVKTDIKYKKHKLITTHTARRSFATNLYRSGVGNISIMKITGHRTAAAFMRYIQIDEEENAELLINSSIFN